MRISEFERTVIKAAVLAEDSDAKIFIFGSRADDSKLGGDIDLLIESRKIAFQEKQKILLAIQKEIGEQKIDILVCKDLAIVNNPFIFSILPGAVPL